MIGRINPLYFLLLILVFVLFSTYRLEQAKDRLQEAQEDLKVTEELAIRLMAIKKAYDSKNKEKLVRFLKSKQFQKSGIKIKNTAGSFGVEASSLDISRLNAILSRVFNGNYNVVGLRVKKRSDDKTELRLEIKW